jgi:hypothetical protein
MLSLKTGVVSDELGRHLQSGIRDRRRGHHFPGLELLENEVTGIGILIHSTFEPNR